MAASDGAKDSVPLRRRRAELRAKLLGACLGVAVSLASVGARAADTDSRRQAAEALFQQGKDLLEAGHATKACAKFEASEALDEGLGTLLFLGECYELVGKTASAWRAFSAAADRAERQGDARRGGLARIRAAALEPGLATLQVRAAAQTRAVAGLEVRLNGNVFDPRDLDGRVPIDPGDVTLEVTAPEHDRWEARLEIRPGPSNAVIDIPRLESHDGGGERSIRPERGSPRDEPSETEHGGNGFTTWAIALGAVGVAGVAVGVYLGLDAVSTADRSRERNNCPLEDRCYAGGLKLRDDARSHAHLADVVTGSGAALLLGGVVLFLVAPSEPDAHVRGSMSVVTGPGDLGVGVGGTF
jgi:serine/threonine-protein kinase